jgi:hypothetical protein
VPEESPRNPQASHKVLRPGNFVPRPNNMKLKITSKADVNKSQLSNATLESSSTLIKITNLSVKSNKNREANETA